jgi:hypothetical protein
MGIDLEGLKDKFEIAKKYDESVILSVAVKDYLKLESILVPPENIDKKLEYIKETYNNDLNHKFAEEIRIVAVNSFNPSLSNRKEER